MKRDLTALEWMAALAVLLICILLMTARCK